MIRFERSSSLEFFGCTLTIRLPRTYPRRMNAPVVSIFSTILVAVPAFRRVDPAMTSGPGSGVIAIFARRASSESGVQLMPIVSAPSRLASSMAPRT